MIIRELLMNLEMKIEDGKMIVSDVKGLWPSQSDSRGQA